jgi:hypothetical protein
MAIFARLAPERAGVASAPVMDLRSITAADGKVAFGREGVASAPVMALKAMTGGTWADGGGVVWYVEYRHTSRSAVAFRLIASLSVAAPPPLDRPAPSPRPPAPAAAPPL